jgi:hypothetical protein
MLSFFLWGVSSSRLPEAAEDCPAIALSGSNCFIAGRGHHGLTETRQERSRPRAIVRIPGCGSFFAEAETAMDIVGEFLLVLGVGLVLCSSLGSGH